MGRMITVGRGPYEGDTNAAIQRAADDPPDAGGGTVEVPAGLYLMHDALHLRGRVRVVGQAGTILRKVPSVSSRLVAPLGYGHYEFAVAEPEKFRVGMGVHVFDEKARGFYTTVATIIGRKGDWFYIDRMFNHDYCLASGTVVSAFPVVEGCRVEDASIEGLTVEDDPAETFELNGCRGGGVFLIQCRGVRVSGLEVRNYKGDGISFQQSFDVAIRGCHVHHNAGHGLHPGSGSVRYVMEGNRAHDNGRCGVYYCLRTSHSICRGNELRGNGTAGVSIGERDTHHIIEGNRIAGNGKGGIAFRRPEFQGGDWVRIEANRVGPNGRKDGEAEIAIPGGLRHVHVARNVIEPGQGKAMSVGAGCADVCFAGNTVSARPQRADDVGGDGAAGVSLDDPPPMEGVGPVALPADGAMHLAIPSLPPWSGDAGDAET